MTTPSLILGAVALAALTVGCSSGPAEDGAEATGSQASSATGTTALRFGLPIYSASFWDGIKSVMRANDMVEFQIGSNWDYSLGETIAQDVPGIMVAVHKRCSFSGSTASDCTDAVSALSSTLAAHKPPAGIDYVLYDFEPNYEPEFTQNEAKALNNFAKADTLAWQYGKRIFATPFEPFRGGNMPKPWNEPKVLEAMPHADVINIQLEGEMGSGGVSGWCNYAKQIGAQFVAAGKTGGVFVQVSFAYGTVSEVTAAGQCAKNIAGISGLYIWNASATPADYVSVIKALR